MVVRAQCELQIEDGARPDGPTSGFDAQAIGERRERRIGKIRRALLLADVLAFAVGFLAAQIYEATSAPRASGSLSLDTEVLLFVLSIPWWIWLVKLNGLYGRLDEKADHVSFDEISKFFNVVATGTWVLFLIATATHFARPDGYKLVFFFVFTFLALPVFRATARAFQRRASSSRVQNVLIVGADAVGALIARKIANHPELQLRVLGHIDSIDPDSTILPIVGSLDGISELIERLRVDRLIVGFGAYGHDDILNLVRSLHETEVQLDVVPRLFEVIDPDMLIHSVEGLPLLSVPPLRLSATSTALKRVLDVTLASLGLIVMSPLFLVIAILIRLDSKGPIFFRQVRMGEGGRPFRIYKFRSMSADAEARKSELASRNDHIDLDPRMFKISDDPRITRVGKVLRRYSIDEMPQLLNVLHGEMGMVGPRPLIPEEHEYVQNWARRRLRIKPGITGPWQVMGRSSISFEEMVKLDYNYVMHWSLWRDVRLIARTIPVVVNGRNAV